MHSQGTRDSGWERDEVEGVCWIWEAGPWVRGCAWKGLVLGGGVLTGRWSQQGAGVAVGTGRLSSCGKLVHWAGTQEPRLQPLRTL